MPGLAERIGDALGVPVTGFRPAGRAHGYRHARGTLADGRAFFAKAADRAGGPVAAAFAAEANGLRWLAAADGGPPVPRVLTVTAAFLVTELAGPPSAEAAGRFGAALARMHAAGAASFGAPWPGFIASLPLDNAPVGNAPVGNAPVGAPAGTDWGSWYAQRRLVPYLRRARDDGLLSAAEAVPVEAVIGRIGELAGPPGPPSRIHGDLWSGNLLWAPDRAGAGNGWLPAPRPRTAATGRPTWPCWPSSAPRSWPRSSAATPRRPRWRTAGAPGYRFTSCTRCWFTCACSAAATPPS